MSYDTDVKKTVFKEKLVVSSLFSFLVFVMGIGVSFFPVESFLRSLFVSSILLFGLSYIYAHYKNRLNPRIIFDYLVIALIFFIILIVFKP
jgi:hypothetical protein